MFFAQLENYKLVTPKWHLGILKKFNDFSWPSSFLPCIGATDPIRVEAYSEHPEDQMLWAEYGGLPFITLRHYFAELGVELMSRGNSFTTYCFYYLISSSRPPCKVSPQ